MEEVNYLSRKLNLILTNDDGVNADGIVSLYKVFSEDLDNFINRIVVIAPDGDRSVSGHSITYEIPVKIRNLYSNGKLDIYESTGLLQIVLLLEVNIF